MATYNVFSSKKKPVIYASGSGSQYANNTQKSAYPSFDLSEPRSSASSATIRQPVRSVSTSTYRLPEPKQVVSKTPNPWSFTDLAKTRTTTPTNDFIGPKPVDKPVTQVETPKVQSAAEKYMANIQALGAKQQAAAKQRAIDNETKLKERYALANQGLESQIPELDADLENFRNTEAAGLAEARKAAEAQKATTSDYYGEAQRLAAQTRNETRGQTGRVFANLGTIDSRGEGSYQQGMENIDTEFNRETQKRLNEKAAKLSDIDSTYYKAEVASNNAIRAKEAEKTKLVRQIKLAQQQNNLDLADQLTAAWQAADDSIAEIENNLIQLKYASEQETEKTQRELDQLKGLSESFLTSGKPSTMNDYMFAKDNPDFYKTLVSTGSAKPKSASSLQVEGKAGAGLRALDTIETEILNNPAVMAQAGIWGSPGARQYEAAISSITDAIGGLRTGASVSPEQQKYYRNILPKFGDSPETIKYKLNAVRQELQGYAQGADQMGSDLPPELMSLLGL